MPDVDQTDRVDQVDQDPAAQRWQEAVSAVLAEIQANPYDRLEARVGEWEQRLYELIERLRGIAPAYADELGLAVDVLCRLWMHTSQVRLWEMCNENLERVGPATSATKGAPTQLVVLPARGSEIRQ